MKKLIDSTNKQLNSVSSDPRALESEIENFRLYLFNPPNDETKIDSSYLHNPLFFYKLHQLNIPLLTKIVIKLFCITETSVPAESLFSISGIIKKRTKK